MEVWELGGKEVGEYGGLDVGEVRRFGSWEVVQLEVCSQKFLCKSLHWTYFVHFTRRIKLHAAQ